MLTNTWMGIRSWRNPMCRSDGLKIWVSYYSKCYFVTYTDTHPFRMKGCKKEFVKKFKTKRALFEYFMK